MAPPPQSQVNGLEVTTWPKLGNKGFHTRNLKLEHLETNQVVSGLRLPFWGDCGGKWDENDDLRKEETELNSQENLT